MTRALVTLLLALQPGAAALANTCDNVVQLSGLKGEIYAVGGADASEPCGWHIYPDRRLEKMQFRVNQSTRLRGDDRISFYKYNLQHEQTAIGTFSAVKPISHSQNDGMYSLTGTAAVQSWLRAALWAREESPRRLAAEARCRLRNVADSHCIRTTQAPTKC